jgi:ligand-binding sensor domain-containing protein
MLSAIKKTMITRRRLSIVAGVAALALIGAVIIYVIKLNRSIALQRDLQADATRVQVEERSLRAPSSDGLTLYLNAADVRGVASFQDARYLATSGGLIAVDDAGNVKRRFTTLDGLPDNDLTALAVYRSRLFVGTSAAGLVAFDGNAFTGYTFTKPKATHITVLVPTDTELLIGTLDGGMFEYNGERFARRVNSAPGADFNRVTVLFPFQSRVYIGTQGAGLYVWREAHIEHVTRNDGLPSPHITAIAESPSILAENGSIAVATDFGVVALDDANQIKPISNRPNVTSLAVSGSHLWAGLFGGGVVDLSSGELSGSGGSQRSTSSTPETTGLPASVPATVFVSGGKLWVLTREGAYARDERASHPAFESAAGSLASERVLTTGHITSLSVDDAGRLWIGYFDRGLDLVSPETAERVSHIEDDRVREINYLAFDRSEDKMMAATSRGLLAFGSGLKQTLLTREQGGLINDSVAQISFADLDSPLLASTKGPALPASRGKTIVVVTAGGLTEINGGRARSITAFHGLASNHLYTSAAVGSRLFVGSLAGLVELEGLRVVRAYKTSNSKLSHDWVTALAEAEGTLYIGTNGGGVDALLPTGELLNFSDELGKFEVNQNAMSFDGERLYVGTSDRGLLVYNTRDRRWTRVSAGLASQNVTAITSDDRFVYVGTLNGLVRIEKRIVR